MRGHSYAGKGGYHQLPAWHRQRPANYPQYVPTRNHPYSYSGENALNVKMSTESPPDWGPHKQGDLPYFQYVQLVQEWCRACKVDEEKRAEIVYHHLEGVAKSKISNWLDDPKTRDRRTLRMKKGNMKYRSKQYKESWRKYRREKR